MDYRQLFKSWLLIAVGVFIASGTSRGISFENNTALIVAVLLLSLCNVFLKPLLLLFSFPFIVLTFGVGIWLINAALFLLVSKLVEGFVVSSFWHALWGAFVVSLTGGVASILFAPKSQRRRSNFHFEVRRSGMPAAGEEQRPGTSAPRAKLKDDDVIDI
ncbi:MAG: phage holin family protein [Verrucomicrobiota bacterium]